ncbi:transporter substrate-binding domain-containing protein [Pseudomonas sp. B21-051]|uniref:transporter substrate-binding domain-containing protein n=1 Tax=Pseudomonas sp. B21-051 TaxID=2895491 RepID=UPI00215F3BF8|nr:transporter substrate-binding domain-containing protein [Pseudomonas sp. B21-051]UVK91049.1 transporter substrate-binding domain-containing protein [Pseudomonas sp. B21-051]
MQFERGWKYTLNGFFLVCLLSCWRPVTAAQLALHHEEPLNVAPIALDEHERQWVRDNPRVIVASVQYPLYLFQDEHGHWSGLNSDVLRRISAMTGLQFVYHETFSTDQLLERLESGLADMTTTLAMNDERKSALDFSHAFGGAGWVFVGHVDQPVVRSFEQLSKRVLVLPTRHALESVIRRDYPSIEIRSVKTYAEARALVESGEAYATIENEIGSQLYPSGLLKVGELLEGKWEADHLTLRKGQPELLSILNKALEAFPATELRAIRLKWLGGLHPKRASADRQLVARLGCWGLFAGSVFLILSLIWNRRLAVVIKQRSEVQRHLGDQLVFQRALIDAMPDPVFVRDLEGRLILCNKSYEEALSIRFDQVQGRRLIDLEVLPPTTASLLHGEFMAQLRTRRTRFSKRWLQFNTGTREIYQWTVPFYSADGELRGLLGGWTDITRRNDIAGLSPG